MGGQRNPDEGRIILVVGRLGAGKTAYAVKRARGFGRMWRLPVVANAPLREDWGVVQSWEQLATLPPAVLLLDEVHLWLPSMTGLMPKEQMRLAVELLSFARKRGWTIVATTQAVTRVHTSFRQLMTELVQVRPLVDGFVHAAALMEVESPYRPIWNVYSVFRPRAGRYDTRAAVEPLWAGSLSSGRGDSREPAVYLPDGEPVFWE
jgi:hypothetical protein